MMLICNYERAGNKKWGPESVCRRAPTAPRRTRRERALSFIFFTFKIKKKTEWEIGVFFISEV